MADAVELLLLVGVGAGGAGEDRGDRVLLERGGDLLEAGGDAGVCLVSLTAPY